MAKRIIVGISGASGIVYGVRALQLLSECGVETHLVMSKSAELTLHYEMDLSTADVRALATEVHAIKNVGASIASGSFITAGMLVAPCSIRTMSEIATGILHNVGNVLNGVNISSTSPRLIPFVRSSRPAIASSTAITDPWPRRCSTTPFRERYGSSSK